MQLNDAALGAIGINLNVTLNEDGSGEVAEGSYYPDVNTIEDENGACVTLQQVLPVSDPFNYTSMGNMMEAVGMAHPGVNVLGLPGISPMAGQQLGGLELQDSETFEDFPMFPAHPTLCDPTGTDCFPFTIGDIDESGTLEIYPDVNLLGIPEYVPGGAPLTGLTAGYWLKEGVNTDEITSVYPGNTDPDFHLEWHGVDGADSGLGWGDDAEADEDGDGTWFDRVIGIPGITATFMNPACGFNLPIYGDVSDVFEAMGLGSCVDAVGSAASGYLMNPDPSYATWGNFVTGNAVQFGGCLAAGGDMATCGGLFGANDSEHDFNGTDGRLTMNFDIPCVGIIEAREVIAEFIEVGGSGQVAGCMDDSACNHDETATYDDNSCYHGKWENAESQIVPCYAQQLDQTCTHDCEGNVCTATGDNLLDGFDCAGVCGGDGVVNIDGDSACCASGTIDCANVCDGTAVEDCANVCGGDGVVNTDGDSACCASGTIDCANVCDGDDTTSCLSIDELTTLDRYSITSVYPNPFNPVTSIAFNLPIADMVSIKVFDITGRELLTLKDDYTLAGSHTINWDASSHPSGVYLLQMTSGSFSKTRKIVLMK